MQRFTAPDFVPGHRLALITLLLAALGCAEASSADTTSAPTKAPTVQSEAAEIPDVRLVPAFPQLSFRRPVDVQHAGDGSNRLFVVEQAGRIYTFENERATKEKTLFLDLREKVRSQHNEEGLLTLAFHPKHAENGRFFVYYTASEPRRGVLSSFLRSSTDPLQADPASEEVILEVEQPYGNHNGSTVTFGPDGYLYISLGDGGYAADPHNHGQDLSTLLGTVLRIDVDKKDEGKAYAIPTDNPFVGRAGARPEIWAYGLRNVWRMSFDRETGDLWGGDVGQNRWEEIDVIRAGGNYGWRIREGKHAFKPEETSSDPLIDPVVEYGRREGISVTGGYVYRGSASPALRGVYVYADYAMGRIWGLRYDGTTMTAHRQMKVDRPVFIASFGEDDAGELLICAFDTPNGRKGRIYRVVAQ